MAWYDDPDRHSMMKEYDSRLVMERETAAAVAAGWSVASVTDRPQRSGCMRIILLGGIGALIWKPKSKTLVTFTRS